MSLSLTPATTSVSHSLSPSNFHTCDTWHIRILSVYHVHKAIILVLSSPEHTITDRCNETFSGVIIYHESHLPPVGYLFPPPFQLYNSTFKGVAQFQLHSVQTESPCLLLARLNARSASCHIQLFGVFGGDASSPTPAYQSHTSHYSFSIHFPPPSPLCPIPFAKRVSKFAWTELWQKVQSTRKFTYRLISARYAKGISDTRKYSTCTFERSIQIGMCPLWVFPNQLRYVS